ncbi:MFS transporter [Actinomycetes bacterium KLBMP 9759]
MLAAFAGFAATAVVWFDFTLYGTTAALVFTQLFFPVTAPPASSLLVIATFSVSLVARPLGSIVFGVAGDLGGRKLMLVTALLTMTLATVLIGALPGYGTLGQSAAVLLVTLRFLQGFAIGGMWAGAATLALEHAPPRWRASCASWAHAGTPAGMLLASVTFAPLATALPTEELLGWGWRVPFLASGGMALVVLVVLLLVKEPPATALARRTRPARRSAPIIEVLVRYFPRLLVGALAVASGGALLYAGTTFVAIVGTGDRPSTLATTTLATGLAVITIPLVALLADLVGHRLMMQIGAGVTALAAVPIFLLAGLGTTTGTTLAAMLALPLGYAFASAALAAWLPGLFETGVRATGAGLAYQLGGVITFFLPMLGSSIVSYTKSGVLIGVVIAVIAVVALLAVSLLPRSPMEMEAHR